MTATDDEEEAREYLQRRLAMVFKLMFWSLVGLLAFIFGLYTVSDTIKDKVPNRAAIYASSCVGLAVMAAIWRGLLVRKKLSIATLQRIDLIFVVGIGTAFGLSAIGQRDLPPAAYMSLVWATFAVFARALVVPSSGRRTAILSALAFVPMSGAALVLMLTMNPGSNPFSLPPTAFFFGNLLLSTVPIVLATTGSHIIYGLNRQVSATQLLGQYTLGRKIGEGGMGSVYVASHVLLRRPTAVKILPPDRNRADELSRFEREVQSMSKLSHPNTVAVFDYGHTADGGLYYAMEYLAPGIDLQRLVDAHGPQPAGRVAAILAQVCGALGEAHELGIIHRDIKPGNIILCERGGKPDIAKVVDFGIAKAIGDDPAQPIFGTPGYIAPEALIGGEVGAPADLYALGAVGYFLLTGRRAFEGTATAPPAPPSEAGPELEAILMRCFAKLPSDRFASSAELADALRAVPAIADWTESHARDWWHTFKDQDIAAPTPAASLDTITIDLGVRIA